MKRASQEVILDECLDISRPIRVRKVWTSGTKGVGEGTVGTLEARVKDRMGCLDRIVLVVVNMLRAEGRPRRFGVRIVMMAL